MVDSISFAYSFEFDAFFNDNTSNEIIRKDELPLFLPYEDAIKSHHIKRLYDEETDYNYIFLNDDGSKTVYLTEKTQYDDLFIINKTESNCCFVSTDNNFSFSFSNNLFDDGLTISIDDSKFSFTPINNNEIKGLYKEPVVNKNIITYGCTVDNIINFKYTVSEFGVKEEIILNEFVDIADFYFMINLDECVSIKDDTIGYYIEKNGNEIARISDVFIFDSVAHIAKGTIEITQFDDSEQEYLARISFDKDFLKNKSTVYPVYIDPTIVISSFSNSALIEDVSIYDNKPNMNAGSWQYDNVGYTDTIYGNARLLVKLPGLYNSELYGNISVDQIQSVYYGLYEAGGTTNRVINAYAFEGNVWSENTATWNNVGSNQYYELLDTKSPGINQWVEFDITDLVKGWKTNDYDYNKGFILTNANEGMATYLKTFNSSSYSVNEERPYIKITYLSSVEDGLYYINNLYSGQFLQPSNGIIYNNTTIFQQYYGNSNAQVWYFKNLNNGYYSIRPNINRQYVMSVQDNIPNSLVILNNYGVSDDDLSYVSQWSIISTNDNTFKIVNRSTGLYLDLYSRSLSTSENVAQYYNGSHDALKWRIIKINNYVPSTSISINQTNVMLEFNSSLTFSASVGSNLSTIKSCKWTSSDPSVLSINAKTGIISPIRAGTVTIFATTLDTGISTSTTITLYYQAVSDFCNDDYMYIKNISSNCFMDISGGATSDGTKAVQYSLNGCNNQKFKIIRDSNTGYYRLFPQNAPSKALMCNSSNKVVLSSDVDNQRCYWHIIQNLDGSYSFQNRFNNYIISIESDSTSPSSELVCTYSSSTSSKWDILLNNELIFSSLNELHTIAKLQSSNNNEALLLTFGYIRSNLYDSSLWTIGAGSIDSSFVSYIDNNYSHLCFLKYGGAKAYDMNGRFQPVDFTHLIATLNAYYYDALGGINDIWDAMFGWAGDLQQVSRDILSSYPYISNSDLYNYVYQAIGGEDSESSFSLGDFNADLDAINFIENFYNDTDLLGTQLMNYYQLGPRYGTRVINFIDNRSFSDMYSYVYSYTNNPILTLPGYSVTSEQAAEISLAFTNYLFTH